MAGSGTVLTGRENELSRLSKLVSPPYADSRILLVLGEAGTGKTTLLKQAAREARSAGMRVLTATGRQSESDLVFAGLHQLLRPALGRLDGLPVRQAQALRAAFAISNDPVPPDALLTGIAVLTLLSALSEDQPLLVVVDDAQWLDPASLDAVVFAARRLESEQLVLIFAARGEEPPAGLDRDFPPPLLLPPLSAPDAGRLLDSQPRPPRGRVREQVLAQAAGNPLALIELSAAIAADPQAGRRWASEPLPLTSRLTSVITSRFAALPEQTRTALLLAATAGAEDLALAVPGLTAEALGPAEAAGLIKIDRPPHGSTIRSSGPPSTTPSRSPSARRRTRRSRTLTGTRPTGTPGTWPPRRWNPTSLWPPCSKTARTGPSAAEVPRRRREPWNGRPS